LPIGDDTDSFSTHSLPNEAIHYRPTLESLELSLSQALFSILAFHHCISITVFPPLHHFKFKNSKKSKNIFDLSSRCFFRFFLLPDATDTTRRPTMMMVWNVCCFEC